MGIPLLHSDQYWRDISPFRPELIQTPQHNPIVQNNHHPVCNLRSLLTCLWIGVGTLRLGLVRAEQTVQGGGLSDRRKHDARFGSVWARDPDT